MKPSELFLALTDIDETYINTPRTAAIKGVRGRIIRKWIAVAACAVVLIAAGCGAYWSGGAMTEIPVGIVYPDENEKVGYDGGAISGQYTTEVFLTYDEIVEKSDVIVVADVMEVCDDLYIESYGCYRNYALLSIKEVLKGGASVGETIWVKDNAYRYQRDDGTYQYSTTDGGPMLEAGNRTLLFLQTPTSVSVLTDGTKRWLYCYPYSGWSKFFLDEDNRYYLSSTYSDHSFSLFFSRALEGYEPKTIEEYRELIGLVEVAQTVAENAVYPDVNKKVKYDLGALVI